ncbi:5-oxoprolinase subunit PxpB [Mucilaginibacter ginkgonis]|uniref:5-oxoprolinase subunit PxpB n=1 Tax=Mucilaginibacter ginkgonis TaxID=2682091 RepID=A0A6I4HWS4_9SPHI|nr:5-oxoprolinase subunit PxpB [Mucilaginibacter ginkgonis]QQL51400.1 5-oxoprolinase subunit PxpB [Mucilaginibacter ginkgonis]
MAGSNNADIQIYYLSEGALTVQFGNQISNQALANVQRLNNLVCQSPFDGLISTVPAYTTLSVFFDPVIVIADQAMQGVDCFEKVSNFIKERIAEKSTNAAGNFHTVEVPVCYGGDFGPDLDFVAKTNGLSADEVISIHHSAKYTVGMIGFLPGFAYLMGLDERLATPRKASPRKFVPAGSVGIAGSQTGIYPLDSPGGWQIIGRTPLTMFNAEGEQTSLLKAGDKVVFKPITRDEFNFITGNQYADQDQ